VLAHCSTVRVLWAWLEMEKERAGLKPGAYSLKTKTPRRWRGVVLNGKIISGFGFSTQGETFAREEKRGAKREKKERDNAGAQRTLSQRRGKRRKRNEEMLAGGAAKFGGDGVGEFCFGELGHGFQFSGERPKNHLAPEAIHISRSWEWL
jgi:hypothetical protein